MHQRTISLLSTLCLLAACASPSILPTGTPIPSPSVPVPPPAPPSTKAWAFNYASGVVSYQISRSAAIESESDSGSHSGISTNTTHESLKVESAGDTIRFTATIDSFSTTTQDSTSRLQATQAPIQVMGSFLNDSLLISNDSLTEDCNPAKSALVIDLHNLFVRIPAELVQGNGWRDSVEVMSCQGMIPTTTRTTRSYVASGEATYQGYPVVLVQRVDTIHAHGEGSQQQHRLVLDVSGTGTATYYLSPGEGHIVRLSTGQDLNLAITASGRTYHFKQNSKQDFNLAR